MLAEGCYATPALIANSRFLGLPGYARPKQANTNPKLVWYLNNQGYDRYLYRTNSLSFSNSEEAFAYVESELITGKPVLVTCTPYYLPYHDDFHNPNYLRGIEGSASALTFTDHWVMITGLTDTSVKLYDPIPNNHHGQISRSDFARAWQGSASIPELASNKAVQRVQPYTVKDMHIFGDLPRHELAGTLLKACKMVCIEYLQGRTVEDDQWSYSYGSISRKAMYEDIEAAMTMGTDALANFSTSLINTKISLLFFQDLLHELRQHVGQDYHEVGERFGDLLKQWEGVSKRFISRVIGKRSTAQKRAQFLSELDQLIINEHDFYADLARQLDDVEVLMPSPESSQSRRAPHIN